MRPSSLRQLRMAAVAGSLLVACGAIPSFGENAGAGNDAADLGPNENLDRELPASARVASPLDALRDVARAVWRTVVQDNSVLIWLTPADGTPIAPATTIVDDGAPF